MCGIYTYQVWLDGGVEVGGSVERRGDFCLLLGVWSAWGTPFLYAVLISHLLQVKM